MRAKSKAMTICTIAAMCVSLVSAASAVTVDTVAVGNTDNSDDSTGYGAVDYAYNIGKYEVTAGQYCEFLNAVAKTDTYGLYSASMDTEQFGCQITQHGTSGDFYYDFSGRPSGAEADWVNRPVNYVTWADAARFANWLHNGQETGAQGPTTTEDGAYDLNGAIVISTLQDIEREDDWKWAIPTEDEWYKAAYHKNNGDTGDYFDYPTSNDSMPDNDVSAPDDGNNATFWDGAFTITSPYWRTEVGAHENSESPYDTFDMGGNVWEWNEAIIATLYRGLRGASISNPGNEMHASFRTYYASPMSQTGLIGFRVSQVPEPATLALLAMGGLALIRRRR